MKNLKIFLSYSWNHLDVADSIDEDFQAIGITFQRDKRDVGYHESIKEYMKKISSADYAFMLISDEYLKSKNCMYEVTELMRDEDYKKKMVYIVLDDCKSIYEPLGRAIYLKHWQDEYNNLKSKVDEIDRETAETLIDDLKQLDNIRKNIGEFLNEIVELKSETYKQQKKDGYKKILDFIGFSKESHASEIMKIYKMSDTEEQDIALDKLNKKIKTSRDKCLWYSAKAYIEKQRGHKKSARYYYESAIEINSNYEIAHNNYANLLTSEPFKDFNKAKEEYEIALNLNPDYAKAHNNYANLLATAPFNEYIKAKEEYETALNLNPDYAEAHNNYAILLTSEPLEDFNKAKKEFEKALNLNPHSADVHYNYANLLTSEPSKDFNKAKKEFETVLNLNPDYAEAHNNYANLLTSEPFKDFNKAKKEYEAALNLNPDYAEAHNNYAILLKSEPFKDFNKAKKEYETALNLNPDFAESHYNYALLLKSEHFNQIDKAKKEYEKAIKLNSNLPHIDFD